MKRVFDRSSVAIALVMLCAAATCVRGETWPLEIKRVDSAARAAVAGTAMNPADYVAQYTQSQSFTMATGGNIRFGSPTGPGQRPFSEIVKKELPKYAFSTPFRGVAMLGGQHFAFVLDSTSAEKEGNATAKKKEESKGFRPVLFDRLYVDQNHNGDLTDDPVVEATAPRATSLLGSTSTQYASSSFPVVEVTLDAEGTKVPYAFRFTVSSYANPSYSYASASLSAASYRTAEITLDGKKRRVVVVDFNSNGRFDDKMAINETIRMSDGTVYPSTGDMIYVGLADEKTRPRLSFDATTNDDQHYVSKWVSIDGRFYDLGLTPAGDKLTLTPAAEASGYVTNPNRGYRAVVYNDQGFLKIRGDDSGRAPLPVGQWKLASYTIDAVAPKTQATTETEKPSLLKGLQAAIAGTPRPALLRPTMVSARAKRDYPAVEVRAGETVTMPFGPPFQPIVQASGPMGSGTVGLSLSLVGSGGELCSSLTVEGQRPPKPKFTITAPDGKVVESGTFEYG